MRCDLLIRSYYKDFRWLAYCLESLAKNARGFRRLILVVPQSSREKLEWLGLDADRVIFCRDYDDDYLGQQVSKLHADLVSDADYICHIDSDCIVQRPMRPEDLMHEGRPRIVMTPYSELPRSPWKVLTEKFLGGEVHYNTMRSLPLLFPRQIYPALREFCRRRFQTDLESYVLAQPHRGFSEFNALGVFARRHYADRFHFIDTSREDPGPDYCRIYWSWGGMSAEIRGEIEEILR